jgi:hypothetical protein
VAAEYDSRLAARSAERIGRPAAGLAGDVARLLNSEVRAARVEAAAHCGG